jgi:uncharacterized protein YdeI (YjbR/CyaY-like superfamily)
MDEVTKVDESTEQKTDESVQSKPSEYEIQLRKENEKLRKELKSKLDAETKAKEEALKNQGEFKKLWEDNKSKLDEYDSIKQKLDAIEEKRKAQLLSKLPEGKRDEFKDWTPDQLERVVAMIPETETTTTDRGTRFTQSIQNKKEPVSFSEWKKLNS